MQLAIAWEALTGWSLLGEVDYHDFLSLVALCRDEVKWATHHGFTFLLAFTHSRKQTKASHAYLRVSGEAAGCLPSGLPPPSSQSQEDASCTKDTCKKYATL